MEEINMNLEREADAPKDWQGNFILERDGKGRVYEVIVPDDEEAEEHAADDQTE